jgi:signal transduction histidine kinase
VVGIATNLGTRREPDVLARRDRIWWLAAGGAGLLLSLAYALIPEHKTVLRECVYALVALSGGAAVLVGVHRYRPRAPRAWSLIGLGLLAWSAGDIVWSAYAVADAAVPYPSASDGLYALGYALLIAGFGAAVGARRAEQDWKILLDTLAVMLAGLLIVWVYVVEPVIHVQDATWQAKLFSLLYPLADVVVTAFAAFLFLGTSWRAVSMQLLMIGLVGTLVADIVYYTGTSLRGVERGDVVYLISLTFLALAALHPSMRALTDPSEEGAGLDSRKRIVTLGFVLPVPLVVLAVQNARGEPLYVEAVIAFGGALSFVALLRIDRLLAEVKRSADASRSLTRFSAEMLSAKDDAQLVSKANHVVDELVHHGRASVVQPPDTGGTPHAFAAPVSVEGVPVAEVVADVGPRELEAVEEPLATVASQLALALERMRGISRERELVESLRSQNEELAELDRMKNRFVSSTSHELRTPLTSIVGYLELLLGGEAGELNEEQQHFLEIVNRNCDRLNKLVDDVLFMGRVDSDRMTLEPSEVDLGALVRAEVAALAGAARLKGIDLQCDVQAGELPTITGDATRLTQLLDNLLTNSIKFTPAGGAVTATVTGDAGHVRVAVSDTGVGIPADELPRIFERFFRASTTAAFSGTGLGLPIAAAIAEAHGGNISVVSDVGTGTTFTIELPVRPADDTLIMRATNEMEAATT